MSKQEISSIVLVRGGDLYRYIVGDVGITRIEEYGEPGLHCYIPHLRVWRGDDKVIEVSKHQADVFYSPARDEDGEL